MDEANLYPGDERLEVVGESHYQDALWRIVGGHRRDPVRYENEAVLELEAGTRHDVASFHQSEEARSISGGVLVREIADEGAVDNNLDRVRVKRCCSGPLRPGPRPDRSGRPGSCGRNSRPNGAHQKPERKEREPGRAELVE
jgi:hypothetical protein